MTLLQHHLLALAITYWTSPLAFDSQPNQGTRCKLTFPVLEVFDDGKNGKGGEASRELPAAVA